MTCRSEQGCQLRSSCFASALQTFRCGTAPAPQPIGGRWNPPGVAVIYAAGSQSLAMLERLVQRQNLGRTWLVEAEVPPHLEIEDLMNQPPPNWRALGSPEAVAAGGAWIASAR